jgi:TetR/AcrR family transcriptional regulator
MTGAVAVAAPLPWAERAADRSPTVQRSRARQIEQAGAVVDAARRIIAERGDSFTTQELVKEAGIALQTFYRLFAGKDQLLLAVFEAMIAEHCAQLEVAAQALPDPVARLRAYVTETLQLLDRDDARDGARFSTAQHWRLYQLFPEEMSHATQQFTDLLVRQLELAQREGLLPATDARRDALFVTKLVMAVYHHDAFASTETGAFTAADDLWEFCHRALSGRPGA